MRCHSPQAVGIAHSQFPNGRASLGIRIAYHVFNPYHAAESFTRASIWTEDARDDTSDLMSHDELALTVAPHVLYYCALCTVESIKDGPLTHR